MITFFWDKVNKFQTKRKIKSCAFQFYSFKNDKKQHLQDEIGVLIYIMVSLMLGFRHKITPRFIIYENKMEKFIKFDYL